MTPDPAVVEPPRPTWGVRHAVLALAAGIVASVLAAIVLIVVTQREPTDGELFGIVFAAQGVGTLAAIAWVVRRHGTGSIVRDLGLRFRPSDGWGLPAGFALQIALALALRPLLDRFGQEDTPQEVGRLASEAEGVTVLLAIFAVVLLAPIAEELLFRGLLLGALRRRRSEAVAIIGSAAIFAGVHLLDPGALLVVPALFVAGVVMGIAACRRGDLGLAIAIHAGFNLTAVLALLVATE